MLRRLAALTSIVAGGLGLFVVLAPTLAPAPWLGARLAGAAQRFVTAPVHVGSARFGWWSGIVLEDLRIGPPPGFEADVFRAARFEVGYRPAELVQGRLELTRVALTGLHVQVERDGQGALNLERLVAPSTAAPSAGPLRAPIEVAVQRIAVSDAEVSMTEPGRRLTSGPVRLRGRARGSASRFSAVFEATARPAASGRWGGGRWGLRGAATLTATASMDAAAPFETAELSARLQHALQVGAQLSGGPAGLDDARPMAELPFEGQVAVRVRDDAARVQLERWTLGASSQLSAGARMDSLSGWAEATAPRGEAKVSAEASGAIDLAEALGRVPGVRRAAGRVVVEQVKVGATRDDLSIPTASGLITVHGLALADAERVIEVARGRVQVSTQRSAWTATVDLEGVTAEAEKVALAGGEARIDASIAGGSDPRRGAVTATATATAGASALGVASLRVVDPAARLRVELATAPRFDALQRWDGALVASASRARGPRDGVELEDVRLEAESRGSPAAPQVSTRLSVGRARGLDLDAREIDVNAALAARGGVLTRGRAALRLGTLGDGSNAVDDVSATLALEAAGSGASTPDDFDEPSAGPWRLPAELDVRGQGTFRRATLALMDGSVTSSVSTKLSARLDVRQSRVARLESRTVTGLGLDVAVAGSGGLREPWRLDGELVVRDAATALEALPGRPDDWTAAGRARLKVRARVPMDEGGPELAATAGTAQLELHDFDGGMGRSRARGVRGRAWAELTAARREVQWSMAADRLAWGGPEDVISALTSTGTAAVDAESAELSVRVRTGVNPRRSTRLARGRAALDVWHPRAGGLEVRRAELSFPQLGVQASLRGRLGPGQFGAWQPDFTGTATVVGARLPGVVSAIEAGDGAASLTLSVRSPAPARVDIDGRIIAKALTLAGRDWRLEAANGGSRFSQTLDVPVPRFSPDVSDASGLLGDDFEARAFELVRRLSKARLRLDDRDIRIDSPVTADYQALRPYGDPPGPTATIERVTLGQSQLKDVVFEADWQRGLLLISRLGFSVWQGDALLSAAAQLAPGPDLRIRARGTATGVNLDIPYARAEGREPRLEDDEAAPYRTSGVLDLRFGLQDRQLDGTVDLQRVTKPLLERAFGALELESARSALSWLELSERFGVRPTRGKIWISNNLLSAEFDWERLWLHVAYSSPAPWDLIIDTFFIAGRIATVPTVGASIINIVNSAVRRFSVGNIIDRAVIESGVEGALDQLDPFVVGDRASD